MPNCGESARREMLVQAAAATASDGVEFRR
jgi:hypothetical protein